MFCSNCGAEVKREEARFCEVCGSAINRTVLQTSAPTEEKKEKTLDFGEKENKKPKIKGVIVGVVAALAIILIAVALAKGNSVEKKLTSGVWWESPYFENEAYDYSDSEWWAEDNPGASATGYWVSGYWRSWLFCEYGTIRINYYSTPGYSGGAYICDYEVNADNCPGSFEWIAWSGNNYTWVLLDNNVLVVDDEQFYWDQEEDENTWYVTRDTLRIGNDYYSKKKANIVHVEGLPSYWCKKCGQEGPYANTCPKCGSKQRTDE